MPFTTSDKRKKVDALTDAEVKEILFTYKATEAGFDVGDKCYYFYKKMMIKWCAERRWTTNHDIYKIMRNSIKQNFMDDDAKRAYELAYMVFFNKHVLKYEDEKCELNGDIVG